MEKHEIKLVQKPKISHQIIKVGQEVDRRIAELDIENQVATDETIKTLKSTRAELNNELKDYEAQRKAIKSALMDPYAEMEAVYKTEISEKYEKAVDLLKDKISAFEVKVKDGKKEELVSYFVEVCLSHEIEFLEFSQTNIEVNLTTSMKKYKEQIAAFVEKVKDELTLIDTQENKDDILVEYKRDLNVSRAISEVNKRIEAVKHEEQERLKRRTTMRRQALFALEMVPDDITGAIAFDDDIFIMDSDVVSLEEDEYNEKFQEVVKKIALKNSNTAEAVSAPTTGASPKPTSKPSRSYSSPSTTPKPETKSPDPEEDIIAIIKLTAPMAVLKALGVHMKENGIKYENYKPNN